MTFDEITALVEKGVNLLAQGRSALSQVKDAISDGKVALQPGQSLDSLKEQLAQEEQETAAAISSARDAIAEYRRG